MKKELAYLLSGTLICTVVFLLFSVIEMATKVNAQTGEKKCVWSYMRDRGRPGLGENGKIEMNDNWSQMSQGGWTLKVVNGNEGVYVFEKCN